jgi:hypothetical protein
MVYDYNSSVGNILGAILTAKFNNLLCLLSLTALHSMPNISFAVALDSEFE